jgi:DNA-binding helix-hairpin-helix protein with protein kinase domain
VSRCADKLDLPFRVFNYTGAVKKRRIARRPGIIWSAAVLPPLFGVLMWQAFTRGASAERSEMETWLRS